MPPMPALPAAFLDALRGSEEVLVTSRDPESGRQGTVRMWPAVAPHGVVYLLTFAFSRKVERWRADPWVRLRVPGGGESAEGIAELVADPAEIEAVTPLAVERWDMAGAATAEAFRRLLDDGTHVLVRVSAP